MQWERLQGESPTPFWRGSRVALRIARNSPDATAFRTACFGKPCRTVHADATNAPSCRPVRQLGGLEMRLYALATSVATVDWDSRY